MVKCLHEHRYTCTLPQFQSAYNAFTINIVSGNVDGNFKLDRSEGSSVEIFSLLAKEKVLDYEVQPNSYMLEVRISICKKAT